MSHFADSWYCHSKIEKAIHEAGTGDEVVPATDIKHSGTQCARFEVRNDPHLVDADFITWDAGPVLSIPPGASDEVVDAIARIWHRAKDEGRNAGREDLRRDLRELLGAAAEEV